MSGFMNGTEKGIQGMIRKKARGHPRVCTTSTAEGMKGTVQSTPMEIKSKFGHHMAGKSILLIHRESFENGEIGLDGRTHDFLNQRRKFLNQGME
jgi:hypothetical protein